MELVQESYKSLLEGNASEFSTLESTLKNSDEAGVRMWKTLYMIIEMEGVNLLSPALAEEYEMGKAGYKNTQKALETLRRRALIENQDGIWHIIDPFFSAWLKVHSPFSE